MRRIRPLWCAALVALCGGWCDGALAAAPPAPAAAEAPSLVEQIDAAHAREADQFGELFERVDRLFGEPYLEDRDRKIQVRAGGKTTLNADGDGSETALTFALRVPLPAMQRRANLFLEIGEDINELGDASRMNFAESRRRLSIAAALLARPREEVEIGLKLNLFWDAGSFAAIYPFVRFERLRAPLRYYLEQRVIYASEDLWSTRTDVEVDRTLGAGMFVRLRNRADHDFGDPGVHLAHGLILRQTIFSRSGLSYELWLEYNTAADDPATFSDDTIVYAQLRWRGRVWRNWLEYEINPAYTVVLDSDRRPFASLFVGLTVLWDSYLGGSEGHRMSTRP